MSNKSEAENTTEQGGGESTSRKAVVRKTIRRVRKATPRKEKIPTPGDREREVRAKEEVMPLGETAPGKSQSANPEAPDRGETGSPAGAKPGAIRNPEDPRREESGAPRKIGRVRKEDAGGRPGGERGQDDAEERRSERRGRGRRTSRTTPIPVDAKKLASKAWKLYQADIAEEGIALVDDKTGRHLALRSFDLARIFLEEKAKQSRNGGAGKESPGGGEELP